MGRIWPCEDRGGDGSYATPSQGPPERERDRETIKMCINTVWLFLFVCLFVLNIVNICPQERIPGKLIMKPKITTNIL